MHGQPGHATQICCGTLPNVVVVSTKVLVRELCHKHKEKKNTDFVSQQPSVHRLHLVITHSKSVAPLPAAVVRGISSVQSDPKPVLLVILWLPVSHVIVITVTIMVALHWMSHGQTFTLTQRPRGAPAAQSAPPPGRWCSAGWRRVSDRTGEPAASSASAPTGRNETPAGRWYRCKKKDFLNSPKCC